MSIWADEMKAAAIKDGARVCDFHLAASALIARLDEWSADYLTDAGARDWWGHVEPALARLHRFVKEISRENFTDQIVDDFRTTPLGDKVEQA